MQQHDQIEALLKRLAAPADSQREEALRELGALLRQHLRIEEELFYPAIEERGTRTLVDASYGEHRIALERLEALELASSDSPFEERARELQDAVVQHASDEEIDLFPEVKTLFDREELEAMATRMQSLMQEGPTAEQPAADAPPASMGEQPS